MYLRTYVHIPLIDIYLDILVIEQIIPEKIVPELHITFQTSFEVMDHILQTL